MGLVDMVGFVESCGLFEIFWRGVCLEWCLLGCRDMLEEPSAPPV